jgi:hypothetical protein
MLNNPVKQQRGTNQVVQPGIKANANQKVLEVGDPDVLHRDCLAVEQLNILNATVARASGSSSAASDAGVH